MTGSQFETLKPELRGLRSDFDQRFDAVEMRLTKLEVHLDTAIPVFRSFLVAA